MLMAYEGFLVRTVPTYYSTINVGGPTGPNPYRELRRPLARDGRVGRLICNLSATHKPTRATAFHNALVRAMQQHSMANSTIPKGWRDP